MARLQLLCAFVMSIAVTGEGANILYAIPFTAASHYITLRPIGIELAARGHNVTVIAAHREKDAPKSYNQVITDNIPLWQLLGPEKLNIFSMLEFSYADLQNNVIWPGGAAYTEVALNSTEIKEFLQKDNKFDLVISEIFFNEAFYALAHKYNAPLILVSTFGNCMRQNVMSRNPLQHATVVSEYLTLPDPESFWGRLTNLYATAYEFFWWKLWYLKIQEQLVKNYIPDLPKPVPSLYDIQQNASLILYNGFYSFDGPVAYSPNMIEIGGIHLKESKNKLPEDLQVTMDNANHGIVYVNFGSNVQSSELPEEKKRAFLNVFKKLKQTVIWKWEDDHLENKPDNVIIRKWFPQKEMLTHPNIKVFISHGGLIGTQEAIYQGVPIIGIPIFADQYNNLLQVQNNGFGRILRFQDINEENLSKILLDVLNDDTYLYNAKEASRKFRDRPMSPLDTAIFWIEYVIRHNGAEFMKNPALKLHWFEYAMLDVYAFVIFIVFVVLYSAIKLLKMIFKLCSKSKQKIPLGKKNKKKD